MGYTHYWNDKEPISAAEWTPVLEAVFVLAHRTCQKTGLALEITAKHEIAADTTKLLALRLNGVGKDQHEDFDLPASGFNFCKTAQKPYDVVVTAALAIAKHKLGDKFRVRSDGGPKAWEAGLNLASEWLGTAVPYPVEREEE